MIDRLTHCYAVRLIFMIGIVFLAIAVFGIRRLINFPGHIISILRNS